jgi:hypothetical protein
MNRDDAAFCAMCKKLFRTPVRRSAPPPPPRVETRSASGVWQALLDRLGARERSGSPFGDELVAALEDACPTHWPAAELRIALDAPQAATLTLPGTTEHRGLSSRLRTCIDTLARDHARTVRGYVITIERQPDASWSLRWSVESNDPG